MKNRILLKTKISDEGRIQPGKPGEQVQSHLRLIQMRGAGNNNKKKAFICCSIAFRVFSEQFKVPVLEFGKKY